MSKVREWLQTLVLGIMGIKKSNVNNHLVKNLAAISHDLRWHFALPCAAIYCTTSCKLYIVLYKNIFVLFLFLAPVAA